MSVPSSLQGPPITDKRQLILYHEAGNKPPAAWRVGTEHEKFVFRRADLRRVPYDGPDGIRALLEGMTRFGWEPVVEHGNIIGLSNDNQCSITLEPGGQFELSGAPLATLHQTCGEVHEHLHRANQPRLPLRSRHGAQVPRQPGLAAGRGGAVRQFAVHRRGSFRVPDL